MIKLYILATLASFILVFFTERNINRVENKKHFIYVLYSLSFWLAALVQLVSVFIFVLLMYCRLKNIY